MRDDTRNCSRLACNPGMRGYRFRSETSAAPTGTGTTPAAKPPTAAQPAQPSAEVKPKRARKAAAAKMKGKPPRALPEGVTDHLGQRIMPDWSRHISLAFCEGRPAGGYPRPVSFRAWCGDTCAGCREARALHDDAYYRDAFEPILARYAEARAILGPEEAAYKAAENARREAELAAELARLRAAEAAAEVERQTAEATRRAAEALRLRREAAADRIREARRIIEAARARTRAALGRTAKPWNLPALRPVAPDETLEAAETLAFRLEADAMRADARAAKAEARVRKRDAAPMAPSLASPSGPPQERRRGLVAIPERAQNSERRGRSFRRRAADRPGPPMKLLGYTITAVALFWMLASGALAAESAPVAGPRAAATLVTDTDQIATGHPFHVGLLLRMSPGWHTYWLNPGDAGTAPELTFTLPQGATASGIAWPAPERLQEGPVVTYSYEHEVLLPVTVAPPATQAGPLHLAAHANWLVCEKICVPEEGTFTLDLPQGTPAPSAEAPLFAAAAARSPRPSPFETTIAPDGTLAVTGPGLGEASVASATFFPDAWGPIDQSAPERLSYLPDGIALHFKPGQAFKPDAGLSGLLALRDRAGQASYYTIAAKPGPTPSVTDAAAASAAPLGWPRALAFAMLGGLILNLMPCVFPVLAMKALALARMSGSERRHARAGAWAYLGGVVGSFAALGGALGAARAAGSAVGWGFQFQSPVFVAAIALLLFAIGLNLSGVFSVSGRFGGTGQSLASRGGYTGDFFTGVLAVLVATPCTAPFMAAAIATALAAPLWALFGIFILMGVGLALPYALIAEVPAIARRLPRPGPWMEVLRGILAFPMYGAAAWLVWVLSQQAGSQGLLVMLAGLILVAFAAWAIRLADASRRIGAWVARAAAGIAVATCVVVVARLSQVTPSQTTLAAVGPGIEPYTPARLAALRAEGRPVFVNMTAAWCVTCLVNERVALSPEPVREAFSAHHVAYLKGDWTRQDPAISAFLRTWGRDGVPLYLFYPAHAALPEVLPQILTESTVLSALDRAGS